MKIEKEPIPDLSILGRLKNSLAIKPNEEFVLMQSEYPDLYFEDGKIDLESDSANELLDDYDQPEAFQKIGYARSLGGFFYQFFFAIIGAGFIAATYIPFLNFFFPWPESRSMADIAGVLFIIVQQFFDIPTGFAIERFIGEWRIKNTHKMIMYIRFYIWYQMATGIFLVTGFSLFILNGLNTGDLVWAKWLMLIVISREYPANTGVFISTIRGLQQFNYESYVNFANDTFIKPAFEYGFVFWGQFVLGANPQIGPLLGIAIGYSIGTYVDGFAHMGISMFYLNKTLRPMGYTLWDCFVPKIEKDVIMSSFKFGFVVAIPGLISAVWTTITTIWWYNMVPAYLTMITLSRIADELANIMRRGGGINITATVSEAINNGKIKLTSYYISMSWKFIFFFKFAIGAIILSFMPLLFEHLFVAFGAVNYLLAAGFIVPNIIATIIEEPINTGGKMILGANRPWFNTLVDVLSGFSQFVLLYFYLFIVGIGTMGLDILMWFIPLWFFPINLAVLIAKWRYINNKIAPVKIKEFAWQSFAAPAIPSVIIYAVAQAWTFLAFPVLQVWVGTIIAAVISILFAFVGCLMFLFFPLYSLFGGWDENSLDIFNEAVDISGPSKFLFLPIKKASNWLVKKSPLHNKFKIEWEDAMVEADELMKERHIKDKLITLSGEEAVL